MTLDLPSTYFEDFTDGAVATMRLLHYPPQARDSDERLSRGIGAHTDFGAVTLLLQEVCLCNFSPLTWDGTCRVLKTHSWSST